jgi:L-lactate dehydrogenase
MIVMIASSDPSDASVAPFGGLKAVFTPDPIAVGIPTDGEPILIDMSASITTNGMTSPPPRAGAIRPWAMDARATGQMIPTRFSPIRRAPAAGRARSRP